MSLCRVSAELCSFCIGPAQNVPVFHAHCWCEGQCKADSLMKPCNLTSVGCVLLYQSAVVITGDDVGMVLSPQCFHNLNLHSDIFNHSNVHFWEYMQPGYDTLGFISCTGKEL